MPARKRRPDKSRAPTARADFVRIESPAAAAALAAHLVDGARSRPVVVISIPAGCTAPVIDPAQVAYALGTLAEVCVVPTNEITWELSRALPDLTQVYGGAGRVYPTGLGWMTDYRLSPLRFAYSVREGAQAGGLLIEDAISMSARAGFVERAPRANHRVSGTVAALYPPTRAIVTVQDGSLATVWQELTTAHVSIDQVLVVGQDVVGLLDDATGCLNIAGSLRPAADALACYQPGSVVLVQVTAVVPDTVTVLLHPEVSVTIRRAQVTSNELDSLTDLFSIGEVLPARIGARTSLRFELHLDDVDDDDESLVAPALVPGGPPWLEVRDDDPAEGAPASTSGVLEPVPLPLPLRVTVPVLVSLPAPRKTGAVQSLSLALEEARAKIRSLDARSASVALTERNMLTERALWERRLADADANAAKAVRQLEHERTHRRKAVLGENASRKAQRSTGTVDGTSERDLDAFGDPEDQFRHEVYLAWSRRILKADKERWPLGDYVLGDRFLGSLRSVDGIDRRKVVGVAVEVVTGLAADLDSRELHQLRTSVSGGSGARVRADGATCWRVALQRSTPAARRLHFWRTATGVELARVVTHDDVDP